MTSSSLGLGVPSLAGPGVPASLPCTTILLNDRCHITQSDSQSCQARKCLCTTCCCLLTLNYTSDTTTAHVCCGTKRACLMDSGLMSLLQDVHPSASISPMVTVPELQQQQQVASWAACIAYRGLLVAGQGQGLHFGGDEFPDHLTVQGLLQQGLQQGQALLQPQVCILHVCQLQSCALHTCTCTPSTLLA